MLCRVQFVRTYSDWKYADKVGSARLPAAVRENEPALIPLPPPPKSLFGEDQRPDLGDGGNRAYRAHKEESAMALNASRLYTVKRRLFGHRQGYESL